MPKSNGSPVAPPSRSNHFFKIYLPELSSKHLKIPPAFYPHIEGEAPSRFYLKGPSDFNWGVDLVKRPDGLFFADGWEEFILDHSIATGDFLLFTYNGSSTLSVLIFDNTACEKKDAFSARPTQDDKLSFSLDVKMKEEEKEQTAVVKNHYVKRKRTVSSTYNDCSEVITPTTWSMQTDASQTMISGRLITFSRNSSDQPGKAFEGSRDLSIVLSNSKTRYGSAKKPLRGFFSQRRPVTQEEKADAFAKAQSFKSDKPFFLMVMKGSYVYHGFYLALPGAFPFEHLPRSNAKLFLHDPIKRRWPVNYLFSKRPALSGGWGKFAVGNNLEIDDVCVFELIGRTHIKVHFFRVVEDLKPLLRSSQLKKML